MPPTTQPILAGNSNMASTLRPRSSNLPPRPLSADFVHHSKDASMIFSLLPSAVKARLPRMPSLRRSVSMYGLSRRKSTGSRSGTTTPLSGYTSAMVLSEGSRALMTTSGDEMTEYYIEGMSSDEETQQPTAAKTQRPLQISEAKSGIVWKFANQGLNLLSIAVDESSTITQDPQTGNAPFARQLYIHALTYLLRALPTDLTTEEQLSVRSALPTGVVEPLQIGLNAGSGQIQGSAPAANTEPSLLHRTLASTIIQFFLFVQFLLPYLRYLLSSAYQYDREHKITEKIFSQSIETVDSLGKGGVSLTAAIYNMGDGKVGQVITDTASWLVEGVTGGIHDGVGEGLVIMGARRPTHDGTIERR